MRRLLAVIAVALLCSCSPLTNKPHVAAAPMQMQSIGEAAPAPPGANATTALVVGIAPGNFNSTVETLKALDVSDCVIGFERGSFAVVRATGDNVPATTSKLQKVAGVVYVESDPYLPIAPAAQGCSLADKEPKPPFTPGPGQSDCNCPMQPQKSWWYRAIGAAGRKLTTQSQVVVAVIDSGIELSHPYLRDHLWTNPGETAADGVDNDGNRYTDDVHGWDYVDNDADIASLLHGETHGTRVSGMLLQTAAPVSDHVSIMGLRVANMNGGVSTVRVARAIFYAIDQGASIINLSLWLPKHSALVENALREAAAKQRLMVIAAGNFDLDLHTESMGVYPAHAALMFSNA